MRRAEDLATLERSLFAVGRLFSAVRPADYVEAPIDRTGLLILRRLSDLGPMRPSDLAGVLTLDLSTVSRQVRRLEDARLVVRTAHEEDARACRLDLTDVGADLLFRVQAAFQEQLGATLDGWTAADRHLLATLLARLAADATNLSTTVREPV